MALKKIQLVSIISIIAVLSAFVLIFGSQAGTLVAVTKLKVASNPTGISGFTSKCGTNYAPVEGRCGTTDWTEKTRVGQSYKPINEEIGAPVVFNDRLFDQWAGCDSYNSSTNNMRLLLTCKKRVNISTTGTVTANYLSPNQYLRLKAGGTDNISSVIFTDICTKIRVISGYCQSNGIFFNSNNSRNNFPAIDFYSKQNVRAFLNADGYGSLRGSNEAAYHFDHWEGDFCNNSGLLRCVIDLTLGTNKNIKAVYSIFSNFATLQVDTNQTSPVSGFKITNSRSSVSGCDAGNIFLLSGTCGTSVFQVHSKNYIDVSVTAPLTSNNLAFSSWRNCDTARDLNGDGKAETCYKQVMIGNSKSVTANYK